MTTADPAMIPVAILAGGLATRLWPRTQKIPKSLLEVADEPFIVHQLRLLRREGIVRVVMCVGYLGEMIREFVDDGSRFGLEVSYSFDGEKPLGTGGALRRALPTLGDRFLVLYGDSYLDVAFAPILLAFERSGDPALMTVFRNDGRWDRSNVSFDGRHVVCHDKTTSTRDMHYIDYGLGVFHHDIVSQWPQDSFDLSQLYAALADQGRLAGFEVTRRFYEVGSSAGLAEIDAFLRSPKSISEYTRNYYEEAVAIARGIDHAVVEAMVDILVETRERGGRLFILGVGGGAGHAGHAVNDFRKICGIEAYAPTDNVSELTARINDDGWPTVFANWLRGSHIRSDDAVLVFSVGGGNAEKNISMNIVEALKLATSVGAKIIGVVGRDGGYTRQVADACVVVPTVNSATVTAHTEAFQAVVWHGLVSHPRLLAREMKWESVR